MSIIILLSIAVVIALGFALFNYNTIKKMEEGSPLMQKIAAAIRVGANAFIGYESRTMAVVVVVVAIVVSLLLEWYVGVALIIGALASEGSAMVGMKIATYANVRVTNEANKTRNVGKAVKVAFRGGSVMGLCVSAFSLLGFLVVYLIFGVGFGWLTKTTPDIAWLTKVDVIPFPNVLSGFSLGSSIVALFNRVGGGIYTKAADMGADLVGKTEAHIPEDDPRNPATIADNVGDNVGDVAGLGSDLLESYVCAICSAISLAYSLVLAGADISGLLLEKLYLFPLGLSAIGLLSCCVGIAWLLLADLSKAEDPHAILNMATWISAAGTIIFGYFLTKYLFNGLDVSGVDFKLGILSPWLAAAIGVVAGIIIGLLAEYYTSSDYKPTKFVADSSKEGAALTITSGLGVGMKSCVLPCITLALGIIFSYYISGLYGVAISSIGMLAFISCTVAVDTYGPISDNAGGIAEMSHLDPEVREITDTLDSVGNTTAAIGKGFATGSGALAGLSLMISYMYAYETSFADALMPVLNIVTPLVLAGAIVGCSLPYLFSGILIDAVAKAAKKMVDEVRRQFREKPQILEGKEDPDYKNCIEISTQGAISEMKMPTALAVIVPLICGFSFGPEFVGGVIIGATISSVMIGIFAGNSGGSWDNAKKYIEKGGIEGYGKGTPVHDASVVGDTVGDPLKDTVGPSMDIFVKIIATVALILASTFARFNIWKFIVAAFL